MKATTMSINTELLNGMSFPLLCHAHGTCRFYVGPRRIHNVTGPGNLTDLTEATMDYWALGHIHKSEVLSEEPLVVYMREIIPPRIAS